MRRTFILGRLGLERFHLFPFPTTLQILFLWSLVERGWKSKVRFGDHHHVGQRTAILTLELSTSEPRGCLGVAVCGRRMIPGLEEPGVAVQFSLDLSFLANPLEGEE